MCTFANQSLESLRALAAIIQPCTCSDSNASKCFFVLLFSFRMFEAHSRAKKIDRSSKKCQECDNSLGLQPYPQKVVRVRLPWHPPQPLQEVGQEL